MRVSTTQIYTQGLKAFGNQQTKLTELQEQISTGRRINKPSDDPAASARILELEQTIELNRQYQTNIELAENRLNLEETSITSMENIILRIRELSLQANNATQDSLSRRSIAYEVDQLHDELLSLANTMDANGEYLFAGYQSESKPFTESITGSISHIEFNGDQGTRELQISQSRQINVDTEGRELMMAVPSATALNELATITNAGTAVIAPAHVYQAGSYVADTYTISFDTVTSAPNTTYSVVNSSGSTVATGNYNDGDDIDFMGIRTSVTGAPANGDSFSISPGQYQSVFEIVSNLSQSLKSEGGGSTAGRFNFDLTVAAVTDYSIDSVSFDVDGNTVLLNADYTDLAGLTAAIQSQLDTYVNSGPYQVVNDGSTISIEKLITDSDTTAPLVNNFNGDVDGNTTLVADFISGGFAIDGSNIHDNIAETLTDLSTSFDKMLDARTVIGGRLNALQTQYEDNEAVILATQKTLGGLRDTDLAEAISQLTLEQATLDAAQAVFARITSSSLFNFLR